MGSVFVRRENCAGCPHRTNTRSSNFHKQPVNVAELQQATAAFFETDLTFVSFSPNFNVLIEHGNAQISDQELEAFLYVLESDFFIYATLYIGKFYPCDARFSQLFAREHRWYRAANHVSPDETTCDNGVVMLCFAFNRAIDGRC